MIYWKPYLIYCKCYCCRSVDLVFWRFITSFVFTSIQFFLFICCCVYLKILRIWNMNISAEYKSIQAIVSMYNVSLNCKLFFIAHMMSIKCFPLHLNTHFFFYIAKRIYVNFYSNNSLSHFLTKLKRRKIQFYIFIALNLPSNYNPIAKQRKKKTMRNLNAYIHSVYRENVRVCS